MSRSVTILGATGSVGRSTLDLIARDPRAFEVVALTAHRDVAGLAELARRFGARQAVIGDAALLGALAAALAGSGIEAAAGEARSRRRPPPAPTGRWRRSSAPPGLKPVMRALEGGGTVALGQQGGPGLGRLADDGGGGGERRHPAAGRFRA